MNKFSATLSYFLALVTFLGTFGAYTQYILTDQVLWWFLSFALLCVSIFSFQLTPKGETVKKELRSLKGELRRITWPTFFETWRMLLLVSSISVVSAIVIWCMDRVLLSIV